MEEGAEYATVLAEAQARATPRPIPLKTWADSTRAPSSPSSCVSRCASQVDPEEIVPRPITSITPVDFSYARDLGCTIRQVSRAEQVEGRIAATVGPMLVSLRSPHGLVAGNGEHG